MKRKEKKSKIKRELDQTRFSSFNDLIFDTFELPPPAPFRSLKYSIGTMAKIEK
jgi:hypothetical protein